MRKRAAGGMDILSVLRGKIGKSAEDESRTPQGAPDKMAQNTEKSAQKKGGAVKKILIGIAAAFAVFVVIALLIPSGDTEKEKPEQETEEIAASDLSSVDFETMIGRSIEDIEDMGFQYDETTGAVNGAVTVGFDENGAVSVVTIDGDSEDASLAPSFHGVTLGMDREEALGMLGDAYPALQDDGDTGFVSLNKETKAAVTCLCTDGKVNNIGYKIFSDEELASFKEVVDPSEYIFPDSDSRYLTEDEVRSVEADKLRIGRNEIFARHGGIFESEDLQTYFSQRSWYNGTTPVGEISPDAVFNDFERKNVELIKKVEDEVNGRSSISFIGAEGLYACGTDGDSLTISVTKQGNNSVDVVLGTFDSPGLYGERGGAWPGTIVNENTITVECWGAILTLKWYEKNALVVTRQGATGLNELDYMTDSTEFWNMDVYAP